MSTANIIPTPDNLTLSENITSSALKNTTGKFLISETGLVSDVYNDITSTVETSFVSASTQFAMLKGLSDAFAVTTSPIAKSLANRVASNIPKIFFRNEVPPTTVDKEHVYLPTSEANSKFNFASDLVHYDKAFAFTNGVCTIDAVNALHFRKVLFAKSTDSVLVFSDNYNSSYSSGHLYGIASHVVNADGTCTVTLTTTYTGSLYVIYSTGTGPSIKRNTPFSTQPGYNYLSNGAIKFNGENLSLALNALESYNAIQNSTYFKSLYNKVKDSGTVFINKDTFRDYLTLHTDSDFYNNVYSATRTISHSITSDGYVLLNIQAGTDVVSCSSFNNPDIYSTADTTLLSIQSDTAVHCRVVFNTSYDNTDSTRFYSTVQLTGNNVLDEFTFSCHSFENSTGDYLPFNSNIVNCSVELFDATAHNVIIKRLCQLPQSLIKYNGTIIPYAADIINGNLTDWYGPVYTGHQSPRTLNACVSSAAAESCVGFLSDAQNDYYNKFSVQGPFTPVYYYSVNTDINLWGVSDTFNWNGPVDNTQDGIFQYKAFLEAARYGYENSSSAAITVARKFNTWLNANWDGIANPPAIFSYTSAPTQSGINAGLVAIALEASIYLMLNDNTYTASSLLASKCITYLNSKRITTTSMAGTWSSDSINLVWSGSENAAILSALSLALKYSSKFSSIFNSNTISAWIQDNLSWLLANTELPPSDINNNDILFNVNSSIVEKTIVPVQTPVVTETPTYYVYDNSEITITTQSTPGIRSTLVNNSSSTRLYGLGLSTFQSTNLYGIGSFDDTTYSPKVGVITFNNYGENYDITILTSVGINNIVVNRRSYYYPMIANDNMIIMIDWRIISSCNITNSALDGSSFLYDDNSYYNPVPLMSVDPTNSAKGIWSNTQRLNYNTTPYSTPVAIYLKNNNDGDILGSDEIGSPDEHKFSVDYNITDIYGGIRGNFVHMIYKLPSDGHVYQTYNIRDNILSESMLFDDPDKYKASAGWGITSGISNNFVVGNFSVYDYDLLTYFCNLYCVNINTQEMFTLLIPTSTSFRGNFDGYGTMAGDNYYVSIGNLIYKADLNNKTVSLFKTVAIDTNNYYIQNFSISENEMHVIVITSRFDYSS